MPAVNTQITMCVGSPTNATTHEVTVEGTRQGETFSKSFTITVTDVDEITNITLAASTIAENSAPGVVVGALSSTPAGATWTLTDTAGTRFAISGNNLVTGATATNFEAAATHDVTVRGTLQGETFDKVFTINVTDVDEITDIALSAATVVSASAAGVTVGALTSTPGGATFALTDDAEDRFAIVGTDLVTGATPTDFATAETHDVTVRGTRQGETFDKVLTITVTEA